MAESLISLRNIAEHTPDIMAEISKAQKAPIKIEPPGFSKDSKTRAQAADTANSKTSEKREKSNTRTGDVPSDKLLLNLNFPIKKASE